LPLWFKEAARPVFILIVQLGKFKDPTEKLEMSAQYSLLTGISV